MATILPRIILYRATSHKGFRCILLCVLASLSFNALAQAPERTRQIDSLVQVINGGSFTVERDTLKQEFPEMGFSVHTYLTLVTDGSEVKKHINFVRSTSREKGQQKEMVAQNAFYFDHNQLIKVEEYLIEGDKKVEVSWYYADDKPLYHTLQSHKAAERAAMLLQMAKAMMQQFRPGGQIPRQ